MNSLFAEVTYLLCAFTALACALLLLRGFLTRRSRLLLWSGLCFVALAVENMLLYVDKVLVPDVDLALLRTAVALAGLLGLVFALVLHSES
jgi:hypothetical protein